MNPSRFDRDYRLRVEVANGRTVEVAPPLRVVFDVQKSAAGGLNKMNLSVYNLEERKRLSLVKDAEQTEKRIPIELSVGYQGSVRLLFKGTVHRGQNLREGPDLISELESLDGGHAYLNGFTSETVRTKDQAIETLRRGLPETSRGKITEQRPLIRPRVLVGSSGKLLNRVLDDGETWYIDNEKLYIVRGDEVVSSFIPVVEAATGLLNTPTREQSKVTFSTLMNPTLRIRGLCRLKSATAPHLNGVYHIESMNVSGDTHGADWSQEATAILAGDYRVL